jgi:hypothetical protein
MVKRRTYGGEIARHNREGQARCLLEQENPTVDPGPVAVRHQRIRGMTKRGYSGGWRKIHSSNTYRELFGISLLMVDRCRYYYGVRGGTGDAQRG